MQTNLNPTDTRAAAIAAEIAPILAAWQRLPPRQQKNVIDFITFQELADDEPASPEVEAACVLLRERFGLPVIDC